jgi:hypothetical protein
MLGGKGGGGYVMYEGMWFWVLWCVWVSYDFDTASVGIIYVG